MEVDEEVSQAGYGAVAPEQKSRCPICNGPLGDEWWPHVRAPSAGGERLIHFRCCLDEQPTPETATFVEELRHLQNLSPELRSGREPSVRLSCEELRLAYFGDGCYPPPDLPAPPLSSYALEGLMEIRISACPTLQRLPPEIGRVRGMQALVLISNSLVELPDEVGQLVGLTQLFVNGNFLRHLPRPVCELPKLQEICLDANCFQKVPPITSPLTMLTAPGNLLEELPMISPALNRLELHGNRLTKLDFFSNPWSGWQSPWKDVISLKLMGNQLLELPAEIGSSMPLLRLLLVANNRLTALPTGLANCPRLEWIFVYDNAITELPPGLLKGCHDLARLLLEGNPLSFAALRDLYSEAPQHTCRCIGLDINQVQGFKASARDAGFEGSVEPPREVKIGRLVGLGGPGEHYYMKLVPWSQLLPSEAVTSVSALPDDRADCLVVAFSASQAEPEWLGFLSRVAKLAGKEELDAPIGDLEALLREQGALNGKSLRELSGYTEREHCFASLWYQCFCQIPSKGTNGAYPAKDNKKDVGEALCGFDVLCLVDHNMSWYAADADGLQRALFDVTRAYKRVLFVGASMGGFGAMLHGGRLADAVIAFGPQSRLTDAALRPQAQSIASLEALTAEVQESVRLARGRGAIVEVHCAADDHFWHALQLPLADFALTVHPICPRKPFARLIDKCKMLLPIMVDVLSRLPGLQTQPLQSHQLIPFSTLRASGGLKGLSGDAPAAMPKEIGSSAVRDLSSMGRVGIACWNPTGGFVRYGVAPQDLARMFFGKPSPEVPKPGNWYCPLCGIRNISKRFFCKRCEDAEANVSKARRVPDGTVYPRRGDWGCGYCGEALCGYHAECTNCWSSKSHAKYVVP